MNDFEQVKNLVNLLDVITRETGLHMKGKHLEECPFCTGHGCFSVKGPSAAGSKGGYFKCFQCSEGGDVFAFLEKYLMLDKAGALRKAADFAGIELKERKKAGLKLDTKERIFIAAAEYYHRHLLTNSGAEYFIKKRGHNEDVLKAMKVGMTDGGLLDHLRSKGFEDADIEAASLAKKWDNNGILVDYFCKGLAVFPHLNGPRVDHFTIKDPAKKVKYQLPATARSKQWRFYNQAVFDRYNEVIIVEGENDLLSVMSAGINHVAGIIGNVADNQIKSLRSHAAHKHIYLWMDNDEDDKKPKAKGKGYIRKICTELAGVSNIRIITYSEEYEDPDDYLKAFDGDKKKEIKRLQLEAVNYLTWELTEIAKLDGLDIKLNALKERKVFAALADMVQSEKEVSIEKIERLGLSKEAIAGEIEKGYTLKNQVAAYIVQYKKEIDPNEIGDMVFRHFNEHGRVFHDKQGRAWLFFRHKLETIGNNSTFNALMNRHTGLLYTEAPGRSVWESLTCLAINSGRQTDMDTWISARAADRLLYLNLNGPNSTILKLSVNGVEELSNAMNSDGVFLKDSGKILPVNFMPDAEIQEGMNLLKELVFDNLACEKNQRYYILCWMVSGFLLDFVPYMMLLKFSGNSESGKSTAAKFLSMVFYGKIHLSDITGPGAYRAAANNPLLVLEDLEKEDIGKTLKKFLRLSATRGEKEHSKDSSSSDTVELQPKALILSNAITDFEDQAIINRTWDIRFAEEYWKEDFIEMETLASIARNRNLILSSILKFICADILPNLEKQRDYITILRKEYPGHSKRRMDEYIVMLMLILEKLLKYIPLYDREKDMMAGVELGDKEVRKAWIEYQDAKAKDTEAGSSSIIKLLDGLVREYIAAMKNVDKGYHKDYAEDVFVFTHPEYLLEVVKTQAVKKTDEHGGMEYLVATFDIVAKSSDIAHALDRYCKNNGKRNPFDSPNLFASHLRNDEKLLNKAGWKIVSADNPYKGRWKNHYRVLNGLGYWKLQKVIVSQ